MARIIPPLKDEPTITVFDHLEEMRSQTGHNGYHGFFDARSNTIWATADSLAHEIGHYRDYRSGRMKNLSLISDPQRRNEAKLRNEIVAILFAYAKCGSGGTSLDYEWRFVQWLEFTRKSKSVPFGPNPQKALADLSLTEIQDLADFLCQHDEHWFPRLAHLFQVYLAEENYPVTYGF